jgi:hypothetical protein
MSPRVRGFTSGVESGEPVCPHRAKFQPMWVMAVD